MCLIENLQGFTGDLNCTCFVLSVTAFVKIVAPHTFSGVDVPLWQKGIQEHEKLIAVLKELLSLRQALQKPRTKGCAGLHACLHSPLSFFSYPCLSLLHFSLVGWAQAESSSLQLSFSFGSDFPSADAATEKDSWKIMHARAHRKTPASRIPVWP